MKTLLRNAVIYDGTAGDPFKGDILIEGDRIIKVAEHIADCDDAQVLDLEGLFLAPGFIDAHSHNDWFAIRNEPLKFFDPFIRQGITTFVTGNCGLSAVGFEQGCEHVDKLGGGLFLGNSALFAKQSNNAAELLRHDQNSFTHHPRGAGESSVPKGATTHCKL